MRGSLRSRSQRSIDQMVARPPRVAEVTASKLLGDHLRPLGQVIDVLLEKETADGADLAVVVGAPERHTDHKKNWLPKP